MDIPKTQIKALGKPYFKEEFLKEFITTIERMAPKPERYFLQLTQKENKPTLEFGCKADLILFEATASPENKITCVSPLSAVSQVILFESINSIQLQVVSLTGEALFSYTAVTDEAKKDLREYGQFLQKKIGQSEK